MYYIGIDLGGTNIGAGVVDENCNIVAKGSVPTQANRPVEEIISDMVKLSRDLTSQAGLAESEIAGIGIGIPGSIDKATGTVLYTCNLPFLKTPIEEIIRREWDIPVWIDNDANVAALGEVYAGCAKGCRHAVMITLGTGVGGGLVIDRKIYAGFNDNGAEIGHTVIVKDGRQCTCGRKGCWERYASVSGLIIDTREAMEKHPETLMWELENHSTDHISGKTAFIAAKRGDAVAQEVVKNYCEYIGVGLTNIINIFQPEVLCIGGAISKEGEYLLAPVREFVERERFTRYCAQTELKIATLGNDAGIIGAAMLGKAE